MLYYFLLSLTIGEPTRKRGVILSGLKSKGVVRISGKLLFNLHFMLMEYHTLLLFLYSKVQKL
jgi:hypothetical protein